MKIAPLIRGLFILGLVKAFFIIIMFANYIVSEEGVVLPKTHIKQQVVFLEVPSVQANTLPNVLEDASTKTTRNFEKKSESESVLQKKLTEREKELDKKEKDLRALEENVNRKLQELQSLQVQLDNALKDAETVKNKRLLHLIDVYSNMKSQQAAVVLETLDERIAIQILSGMKGRKAGEILSFVETNKAAKLSEQLTKLQIPFK